MIDVGGNGKSCAKFGSFSDYDSQRFSSREKQVEGNCVRHIVGKGKEPQYSQLPRFTSLLLVRLQSSTYLCANGQKRGNFSVSGLEFKVSNCRLHHL